MSQIPQLLYITNRLDEQNYKLFKFLEPMSNFFRKPTKQQEEHRLEHNLKSDPESHDKRCNYSKTKQRILTNPITIPTQVQTPISKNLHIIPRKKNQNNSRIGAKTEM